MPAATYPLNVGTATAATVFGTTAVAVNDLASQILSNFSVSWNAEKLEIRGNNGAVIGVWYFNATKTGSFDILKLTTGNPSADEPGETMTIPIAGSGAVVIIDQVNETRVQNDTVKLSYNWTYYPAVTP
jgi:hypothetical protein